MKKEAGLVAKSPRGTFIPIKEATIVGTEKTIVIPEFDSFEIETLTNLDKI